MLYQFGAETKEYANGGIASPKPFFGSTSPLGTLIYGNKFIFN